MKGKTPFYNIANMFFTGTVFSIILAILFFNKIDLSSDVLLFFKDWQVIISAVAIVIMYEIGFILNRMSSLLIEFLLVKKTKIWPRKEYDIDVSEISNSNSKFQSMITEVNVMRTHILMYMLLSIISLFSPYKWMSLIFLGLVILFVLGGKKHNDKINKIRQRYYERKKKTEEQRKDMQNLLEYDGTEQK